MVGLAGGAAAARVLAGELYAVPGRDPLIIAGTIAVVPASTLSAC